MKEYTLKRWYPTLPVDWKHPEIIIVVEREHGFNLHPSLKNSLTEETIRFGEVTHSEFWEEVLPKEYEILTFISRDSGYVGGVMYTTLRTNGKYLNSNCIGSGLYPLSSVLKAPHWKINKVRRISDGEVFTVGDRLKYQNSDGFRVVIGFEYDCNILKANFEGGVRIGLTGYSKLKPLFTTEDGVEVYSGFTVYQVSLVGKEFSIHSTEARKEITPVPSYFKYFSTEAIAKQYIVMNKPVLSVLETYDIMLRNSTGLAEYGHVEKLYRVLKEEANKKL